MADFRFIKTVVYKLKRRYGQQILLTKVTSKGTSDYTTGTISGRTTDTKNIKKAVILPSRQTRNFNYDLSYIAANKNFTYGGFYDISQRDVIIENKDLGTFVLSQDTMITFNSETYEIKEFQEYPNIKAWYLVMVRVKGDRT